MNRAHRLEGASLEKAFQEKRIHIGDILFHQLKKVTSDKWKGEITGIRIPVNPDAWRWIGPHPQNEPIDVSLMPKDYRAYIESLQVPFKDYMPTEPTLLIGKTLYPITINDPNITGWINNYLPESLKTKNYDNKGVQLLSNVFDGGTAPDNSKRTDWPAIVEHLYGYRRIKNEQFEKDIEFFFYEDQE